MLRLSDFILKTMESQGRNKAWVAEQTNIKYRTFLDKLDKNTFTAVELIKLSKLLNINLEKLKEEVNND